MEQSTKSNMRNAACLIGVFILGLCLADAGTSEAPKKDATKQVKKGATYQVVCIGDSMYVYMGARFLRATQAEGDADNHDGVQCIINEDNY